MIMMRMIILLILLMATLAMENYKLINKKGINKCKEFLNSLESRLNFGIKDFEFIRVLGTGAFGAVWLVKKKNTNDFYAMKVIECSSDGNFIDNLKAERNVFELLDGEFVVKAYYSFTYENYLFFLLEYMKGGDFASILEAYCALDEKVAKFYIAEIVLAIDSLH